MFLGDEKPTFSPFSLNAMLHDIKVSNQDSAQTSNSETGVENSLGFQQGSLFLLWGETEKTEETFPHNCSVAPSKQLVYELCWTPVTFRANPEQNA